MIPICMIINSKYVNLLLVNLTSIIAKTKSTVCLYLIHSELKEIEVRKIEEFLIERGGQFIEVRVDRNLFNDSPILHSGFSKEGYYKLLLPNVLPVELSKILYFDVDIIVNTDIKNLYDLDIGEKYFGAVADYMVNKKMKSYIEDLGFFKGEVYINTGVLLINLTKLRNENNFIQYINYIKEEGSNFRFHDQQVINYFYHGKFMVLEEKYNYNPQFRGIKDFVSYFLRLQQKPDIIHYSGMKPWYPYYWGKYYENFWKYALKYIEVDWNRKGRKRIFLKFPIIVWNYLLRKNCERKRRDGI